MNGYLGAARGGESTRDQRRKSRGIAAVRLAAMLATVMPCAVFAQTESADGGDQASEPPVIMVTAERRSTDVQRTPISVSVISGDQLADRQITEIQSLETQVPGLSYTQNGFTSNINLRGLGNTTTSPNITTGVAVFHDGLYQPEAILLNTPFYDIASVEVLRGPQGTIIGQNSTGGSLQVNSRNPELSGGVNGFVDATVGNYNLLRLQGAVNLPISQTVAARVAFNVDKRDSFYTNLGSANGAGTDPGDAPGSLLQQNLRLGLLWEPSDSFRALLKAEFNYLDGGGLTPRPRPACATCTPFSSFYQFGYDGPSALNGNRTPGPFDLVYNTQEKLKDTANRFSLELRYILPGGVTLRSLSGYQHLKEDRIDDSDGSAAPVGSFPAGSFSHHLIGPKNDYYSQEFNVISPDGERLTWLVGASYFHRETPVDLVVYPDGTTPSHDATGASLILRSNSRQELIGVFGQIGYQLTPALQIQAGGRYSFDRGEQSGLLQISPFPGVVIPVPIDGVYKGEEPTGKIALNWDVDDRNFVYAFYARGYKQGGINSAVSNFGPEKVDDYEIGWKSKLFGNQALLQIGGYYMRYAGMQQQVFDPQTTLSEIRNIGDSKIYGVEASIQSRFGPVSFDAGLAYNKSKLGAISAVATYQLPAGQLGPQCAPGQTVGCFDYTPYIVNLAGEDNPYAPKITANASLGYTIELGGDARITPRVSVSHSGAQYASIFQNTDYFRIPARTTMDATLEFRSGDWGAEAFVRNATNKLYVTGLANAAEFYGAPRTFGLSVSREF
ncbi:MAG TPA: TonB-dependent receptor [Croceibacterium sp.]|nr:TonB-dependent receptor [Croceibacterium sp.]